MVITWEAIGGLLAIVVAVQGAQLWVVRAVVRSEVAKLNGTYIRRELCEERHNGCRQALAQRIRRIEAAGD